MSGRAIVLVLVALAIVSTWGTLHWIGGKNAAIDLVVVAQARLTLAEDHGENLSEIKSGSGAMVFYRVTLKDVPLGEKQLLHCAWIDPQGQRVWRRSYQTPTITSPVLQTDCKTEFGPASVPGTWTVEMYLQRRKLSQTSFRVR